MGTLKASFVGDVALVTGASGGMGRAIAVAFAEAGASVVLADLDEPGGAETLRQVDEAGARAWFVRTDISDAASIEAAVAVAVGEFGKLDCAVNAAAIENESVPLHECSLDNFERMQAVNVTGCFLSMKYEIAAMLNNAEGPAGRGAIVNIASTNSYRPQHNQPAYTASKHAVLGLTRSASLDYSAPAPCAAASAPRQPPAARRPASLPRLSVNDPRCGSHAENLNGGIGQEGSAAGSVSEDGGGAAMSVERLRFGTLMTSWRLARATAARSDTP